LVLKEIMEIVNDNNNPLLVSNKRFLASVSAYKTILSIISILEKENQVTKEEKEELLLILEQVYHKRKVQSYLSAKIETITKSIEQLIESTVNKQRGRKPNPYYYNSISHSVKDEW
jgi:DNA-binding protein H-NS